MLKKEKQKAILTSLLQFHIAVMNSNIACFIFGFLIH